MTKDNNKIKWKCRRGLWELDILLSKFAEFNYPLLSKENKLLFETINETLVSTFKSKVFLQLTCCWFLPNGQ